MPQASLDCEFGSVSYSKAGRVSVTVKETENFGLTEADELLRCKRADVSIRVTPEGGEGINQRRIPGTNDAYPEIRGNVDIKGFRVVKDAIAFGLTFSLEQLEDGDLREFAEKPGKVIFNSVSEIPEKVKVKTTPAKGQQTFDDHPDTGPQPRKRGRRKQTAANTAFENA